MLLFSEEAENFSETFGAGGLGILGYLWFSFTIKAKNIWKI